MGQYEAAWIERRIVRGVVYASSKTAAVAHFKNGGGREIGSTKPDRQAVRIERQVDAGASQ